MRQSGSLHYIIRTVNCSALSGHDMKYSRPMLFFNINLHMKLNRSLSRVMHLDHRSGDRLWVTAFYTHTQRAGHMSPAKLYLGETSHQIRIHIFICFPCDFWQYCESVREVQMCGHTVTKQYVFLNILYIYFNIKVQPSLSYKIKKWYKRDIQNYC